MNSQDDRTTQNVASTVKIQLEMKIGMLEDASKAILNHFKAQESISPIKSYSTYTEETLKKAIDERVTIKKNLDNLINQGLTVITITGNEKKEIMEKLNEEIFSLQHMRLGKAYGVAGRAKTPESERADLVEKIREIESKIITLRDSRENIEPIMKVLRDHHIDLNNLFQRKEQDVKKIEPVTSAFKKFQTAAKEKFSAVKNTISIRKKPGEP